MDSIEKASFLMGKSYTKTQEGAAHSSNVTMITGTATSDSSDGVVSVDLGGNTISANDEQAVDISTTCAVKAGDVVQVSVIGADGTAKSLLVTGVIAGGDRMNENIEAASSDASAAKETADVAQQVADVANTNASTAQKTANTTKKYFYNDESGSHVRNQDSTSAGTRADIKTDGLHVIDQDDGKELASFTSSGAAIGKDSETHSRYSSDGVRFYEGGKSYPFSQIKPVTYKNEKYSAAVFTTAPDDISTDDGLYHSGATVDVTAINGTATDNTGTGRVVLTATTVQSADLKKAYIDVFASNNNPNKASGGKTVEDTYINLVAEGIYFNSKPLIDYFYPVGAIYISMNAISPAELFGGSWEQIKDRFILAAGDTYAAGTTGGNGVHSHRYGLHFWGYYNSIVAPFGTERCMIMTHDYKNGDVLWDNNNYYHQFNSYPGQYNAALQNNTIQNNSISTYYAEGDTATEEVIPPYFAAYAWRRIA